MEGLCLLLAALSATVPPRGAAPRDRAGTPRLSSPTAPTEPMRSPSTPMASVAGNVSVAPGPRALRLAGGRSLCEGRVELEQAGSWGTVCDDGWDLADADVVCRQLGCGRALRAPSEATFGRGDGPILRDELGCGGHEEQLWDCPAATGHDCSHKEDAGVVCSEHQEWRLAGGRDGCSGWVEVFYRGAWSTVCDSSWYETEADVLCHWLGCGGQLRRPSFAPALPSRMLYQCGTPQPSLAHCYWIYNKSAPCYQSQAAGVICNGSLGLQPPTPMAVVTPSNVTIPSEGSLPAGTPSPLPMSLFVPCLVLAALLLLAVLAFTAALLRVRKMSAHAVSLLGLSGPVPVTHSAQSPDVSSGTSNDYREMPRSLPKGPEPPVITAKDSDDSDYEHYDFSRQPPVALSTFYNSLRRPPGEQLVPLVPNWDGMEPFPAEAPAGLGSPSRGRTNSSSTSSSSSSPEPYCNGSTVPPRPWGCPPPPAEGTHWDVAPTAHGYTPHPGTGVPAPPAAPGAADSSSTSSGEWYENVSGGTQPPGDPAPRPGWPAMSCPVGGHIGDPHSSEGSDYDDIQGAAY